MSIVVPDLGYLLDELDGEVRWTLDAQVEVVEKDGTFTADQILSSSSSKWMKLPEVVAVAFDLKSSTKLGLGRHDISSARIYQSGVGGAVKCLNRYSADFIDIQGDGGFGLFWGEKAYERALCSAITLKTFSVKFVGRLVAKFGDELPDTGFKLGIHSGRTLVKKIGTLRNQDEQEPVWAGKPINYAYKCAQSSDAHVLVVTEKIFEKFKKNDFVVYSCGCADGAVPSNDLWREGTIEEKLPDHENTVFAVSSPWCENCGPRFAEAIMNGETKRGDVTALVREEHSRKMARALERKQEKHRQAKLNRVNRA